MANWKHLITELNKAPYTEHEKDVLLAHIVIDPAYVDAKVAQFEAHTGKSYSQDFIVRHRFEHKYFLGFYISTIVHDEIVVRDLN